MYIPYSMDESEPDLYGGMGGQRFDVDQWETQTKWKSEERSDYPNVKLENVNVPVWYTQEQMDKVIQFNIKALHLAREESYDEGYRDGYIEGNENCQHR